MSTGHKVHGRFRLLRCVGWGSCSGYWLAEEELDAGGTRLVALKRTHVHIEEFAADFERARRTRHPNLVAHHELLEDEGGGTIVILEYFPCRSLSRVLERAAQLGRPLPLSFAVWIVAQLCRALEVLERPHPELSPRHIQLSLDGAVKFSGAFLRANAYDAGPVDFDYVWLCSREDLLSGRADIRSNIFSLGVLLWQLATGEKYFPESYMSDLQHNIEPEARPASRINPQVPAALDAALLRASAYAPRDRYQTPAEFREALESMAAPAPSYVAELFEGAIEENEQLIARSIAEERRALEAKIVADPRSPGPYLVLADWLQQKHDPRGELIMLDHQLKNLGYVTGSYPQDLRRELEGAHLDEGQRALVEREAELLERHGDYLTEGIQSMGLRHVQWRLGFIGGVVMDINHPEQAQGMLAHLAVAPSARFLQALSFVDRCRMNDFSALGVWRFDCLRRVTRAGRDLSIPLL